MSDFIVTTRLNFCVLFKLLIFDEGDTGHLNKDDSQLIR